MAISKQPEYTPESYSSVKKALQAIAKRNNRVLAPILEAFCKKGIDEAVQKNPEPLNNLIEMVFNLIDSGEQQLLSDILKSELLPNKPIAP